MVPCNPKILQNNFILTRNHGCTEATLTMSQLGCGSVPNFLNLQELPTRWTKTVPFHAHWRQLRAFCRLKQWQSRGGSGRRMGTAHLLVFRLKSCSEHWATFASSSKKKVYSHLRSWVTYLLVLMCMFLLLFEQINDWLIELSPGVLSLLSSLRHNLLMLAY